MKINVKKKMPVELKIIILLNFDWGKEGEGEAELTHPQDHSLDSAHPWDCRAAKPLTWGINHNISFSFDFLFCGFKNVIKEQGNITDDFLKCELNNQS